jgi:hypothetical protein
MLPLDSTHWDKLSRWANDGTSIPDEIAMLKAEIHTEHFDDYWSNFRDIFICQCDISEAAIAIVPHILAMLPEVPIAKRPQIVYDTAWIVWLRSTVTSDSVTSEMWAAFDQSLLDHRQDIALSLAAPEDTPNFNLQLLLGAIALIWGNQELGEYLSELEGQGPNG